MPLAAGSLGAAIGLWLPRRIILRRLAAYRGDPAAARPDSARSGDAAFAAALGGGLLATQGLVWTFSLLCVISAESWRQWLFDRFAWPMSGVALVQAGFFAAFAALAGAVGVTALVALHGWYRLLTAPRSAIGQMWSVIAGGISIAAVVAARSFDGRPPLVFAALGTFAAAVICALPSPRRSVSYVAAPPVTQQPRLDGRIAALGGAAALLALCCLFASIGDGRAARVSGGVLLMMASGTLGLLAVSARGNPVAVLVAGCFALGILVATGGDGPALALVVCSAVCAAGTRLNGRRIWRSAGSVQTALARTGVALALGLTAGFAAGALLVRPPQTSERTRGGATAPSPDSPAGRAIVECNPELHRIAFTELLLPAQPLSLWNLERSLPTGDLLVTGLPDGLRDARAARLATRLLATSARSGRLLIDGRAASSDQFHRIARRVPTAGAHQVWRIERAVPTVPGEAVLLGFGDDLPDWLARYLGQRGREFTIEPASRGL